MRRVLLLLPVALLLGACTAGDPEPTDPPRPPSMDGEWLIERVVTESHDEAAFPVGSESTLAVSFTESECTATECTGTVISGLSIEERETVFASGRYRSTAESLSYEFDEVFTACVADGGGPVLAENAYASRTSYEGVVTEADADRILAFTATGVRVSRTTDIGLGLGTCRPDDGEVAYDLTALRAD